MGECGYYSPRAGPSLAGWMFNLGLGVSERGQSVQCLQFGAKPISPLEAPGPLAEADACSVGPPGVT